MPFCKTIDCNKDALFNYKSETEKLYCKECKLDKMVNLGQKSKLCKKGDCITRSGYYFENNKSYKCCSKCKDNGMISIEKNKKITNICKDINCNNEAKYNYKSQTKKLYCDEHKLDNMINLRFKSQLCKDGECITRATYYFKNNISNKFCLEHKQVNMISLHKDLCIKCNITRPTFNLVGKDIAEYCKDCRTSEMVDVNHKKCIKCNTSRAYYNDKDKNQPLYCIKCKDDGMNHKESKLCIKCEQTIPVFNNKDEITGVYCNKCKDENMIDVKHTKCKIENCQSQITKKYNGYCFCCYILNEPESDIYKQYKLKEKYIINVILQEFKHIKDIKINKTIYNGSSNFRPDILMKISNNHYIIIEIDENQHKLKEYKLNEEVRNKNIKNDFNNKQLTIIRFNPDKYIDKDNIKHSSLFAIQKNTNIPVIKNKKIFNNRLKLLTETINKCINLNNEIDNFKEIKLFYDEL